MRSLLVLSLLTALPALGAKPVTKENGAPADSNTQSQTTTTGGPVLLQDFHLLEKLARFDRERIPERVVHARGVGAHGSFKSAGDLSRYTKASLLSKKGKETPMFVRFSTVIHPSGSPETLRDPRGFALKFYTDEGNWDVVGNNLNVFFIRDAIQFPDMVHSLKMSPVTNQQDPNRFFTFFASHPESTHMLTQLYSDLGIPASYRTMDGSSVHALTFVNAKGERFYAKLSWKSRQGNEGLKTAEEVAKITNASHATKDLYDAISAGKNPAWELRAQIIPVAKVNDFRFNPLDATKSWPESDIPPVVLGTFELNRVPENFFEATEQSAFSPGVLVPGVEASEDRLLQGRIFSYADTQRYRIGANYQQLSVNAPRAGVTTNNQGGSLSAEGRKGDINFETKAPAPLVAKTAPATSAAVDAAFVKTEDFFQAGDFYRALDAAAKARLVDNFAGDLRAVKSAEVKQKIIEHLTKADAEYGARVAAAVASNKVASRAK